MQKGKGTWVVIADGSHARFLIANESDNGFAEASPELTTAEPHSFARELKSDRPGRSFGSRGGGVRHAIEPKHDYAKMDKHKFTAAVAKTLDSACLKGAFDRLVLIAPRRSLGELRELLPERVQARVVKEIPKDLTKLEAPKLWTVVAPVIKREALKTPPATAALGRTSAAGRHGKGTRTF